MAVPKRKMSRSNTRHRRAHWRANTSALVPVTIDGSSYPRPSGAAPWPAPASSSASWPSSRPRSAAAT
ncbi:50S ribosomal protein L32 [Streptomyces sp. C1-2]|nr:50S ribosomal protein L32 [Streptomyces sp. C1-2]